MFMAIPSFWKFVCVGVVIGVGAGYYLYKKTKPDEPKKEEWFTFEGLIKNQEVVDTLDGHVLAKWFRENAKLSKGEPVFFLLRVNENAKKALALDTIPEKIDVEHNILQAVVDKDTNLPVAIRLVSFAEMAKSLEAALASLKADGYVIVKADDINKSEEPQTDSDKR